MTTEDRELLVNVLIQLLSTPVPHQAIIARLRELLSDGIRMRFVRGSALLYITRLFNTDKSLRFLLIPLAAPAVGSRQIHPRFVKDREQLDDSAFEVFDADTPAIAASVAVLRLLTGRVSEEKRSETVAMLFASEQVALYGVLQRGAAGRGMMRAELQIEVCRSALMECTELYGYQAFGTLRQLLEARRTTLSEPAVAKRLKLPFALTVQPPA
ncbi:hypothetical protein [Rhodopila sp.]|uniref:hypothetical protein n=1 Tax=Rhodopila sp. TaxID=2480087 RepID=UPI003D131078